MNDVSIQVSERMRRVKSRNTSLEKSFSKLLRLAGIKYQGHPKVYGHPDFRIKGTKILIFCDSSFWHGRNEDEISGKAFKRNRNFWVKKLKYNKERDEKITVDLKRHGWKVLRFWDDDIIKRPNLIVRKINRYAK